MREAVLDVGSNTAHLLVVDAYRGAAPLPASSRKETLRLAEHLTAGGALAEAGVDALISFIGGALTEAENQGCESVTAFATSAIREATNTDKVLSLVRKKTGITLTVLSGEDEARLTFLAVRRWFGWSSGRLAVFDIGGGSLEAARIVTALRSEFRVDAAMRHLFEQPTIAGLAEIVDVLAVSAAGAARSAGSNRETIEI